MQFVWFEYLLNREFGAVRIRRGHDGVQQHENQIQLKYPRSVLNKIAPSLTTRYQSKRFCVFLFWCLLYLLCFVVIAVSFPICRI